MTTQNATSTITQLDSLNFDSEVSSSVAPVVIDFYADWCAPCRQMEPIFEKLADEYEGRVRVARVDVDESPELASRFGVRGIPHVIALRDGAEVDSQVGFGGAAPLRALFDSLA